VRLIRHLLRRKQATNPRPFGGAYQVQTLYRSRRPVRLFAATANSTARTGNIASLRK
jgi:hypothetical protein